MAEAQKTLRVTQIKSSIGYKKDQLATLKSLGLGKIGRSTTSWTTSLSAA